MKAPAVRTLVLLVLLSMSGSCILGGRSERRQGPGDLDFKLGPFTYLEEGKLIALAVGTEAARYREKERYFPLSIAIANKGVGPLTITRESFTLQDENGRRYAAVPVSELNTGYGPTEMDRNFTSTFSVFLSRFSTYDRAQSNFYPSRGSPGIVFDRVELHRFNQLFDWLYFPKPDDGLLGRRFELHFSCEGLDEEVFVKFRID